MAGAFGKVLPWGFLGSPSTVAFHLLSVLAGSLGKSPACSHCPAASWEITRLHVHVTQTCGDTSHSLRSCLPDLVPVGQAFKSHSLSGFSSSLLKAPLVSRSCSLGAPAGRCPQIENAPFSYKYPIFVSISALIYYKNRVA